MILSFPFLFTGDKNTGCSKEAELVDEDMSDIPQLCKCPVLTFHYIINCFLLS